VAVLAAVSCGGDAEEAENACLAVADGFAHAWERCGVDTFENAQKTFRGNLSCGKSSDYDDSRLGECLSAIEALPCPANSNPASCQSVINR
jgi:hypothetical protein